MTQGGTQKQLIGNDPEIAARLNLVSELLAKDLERMAAPQSAASRLYPSWSLELRSLLWFTSAGSIFCDVSQQIPLVLEPMRRLRFDALHGLSHSEIHATKIN
ncbi:unnamed protein product [Echinostoma caproni]|uniref:Uncharacterized protein n=1 Tax=Echinostoma caproni TaxID=27848 RepID=A0A183AT29_9TREM|nr:unnamed protein product [Echinostoma caproni]